MISKIFKLIFLTMVLFLSISSSYASTGKYALLIFGGHADTETTFQDEPFVQHEIAPMYKTLVQDYDYGHENIWVLNLDGGVNSYKSHFSPFDDDDFEHYLSVTIEHFSEALEDINIELQNNDANLVFIYISGHQGVGTGENPAQYHISNGVLEDSAFADTI
jgi:hypothetical protein